MIGTISNFVGNVIDTVKSPFVGVVGVKSVSKRNVSRKMSKSGKSKKRK